jgi:hypothetical protein
MKRHAATAVLILASLAFLALATGSAWAATGWSRFGDTHVVQDPTAPGPDLDPRRQLRRRHDHRHRPLHLDDARLSVTYRITLDTGYDSGEHTLEGGNVQIH